MLNLILAGCRWEEVSGHGTTTSHETPNPSPLFGTMVIWSAIGGNALSHYLLDTYVCIQSFFSFNIISLNYALWSDLAQCC